MHWSADVPLFCEVSLALRALSKAFYPQTSGFRKEHLLFDSNPEMVPSAACLGVWLGSFVLLQRTSSYSGCFDHSWKCHSTPRHFPAFVWEELLLPCHKNPCKYKKCILHHLFTSLITPYLADVAEEFDGEFKLCGSASQPAGAEEVLGPLCIRPRAE